MNTRPPFQLFPRGWFHAAYSDELPPGKVLSLKIFGKDLVLFRGEDGKPAMLDAYCPHLGAHLGHGGKVEGASIRCPFHGWRFASSGACVEVPFGNIVPAKAKVPCWLLRELNGHILMHHDPAGKEPAFEIPELAESVRTDYAPFERKRWKMRTNLIQPLENIFDAAHYSQLHEGPARASIKVSVSGHIIRSHWDTSFRGPAAKIVEGTLDWEGIGMGYGTMFITGVASALLVCSCAPIDQDYTDFGIWFWARNGEPMEVQYAVFRDLVRLIDQDVEIWEHKVHLAQPLLSAEEGCVMTFRNWCGQFV